MSGSDFRLLILDPVLRRARHMASRKGVIALVVCMLLVLPMNWARSRSDAPTVLDRSDVPTAEASTTDPVWSDLPGVSMDPSPVASPRANPELSVESLTVYPDAEPFPASSTSVDSRQLMLEIQRRLARMTGESAGQTNPAPRSAAVSRPPTAVPSFTVDGNAPLQLFRPAGWAVAAETPKKVPPAPAPAPLSVTENRPDPNLNVNPATQAAFARHLEMARDLQRQGQYARAADAFTLALAYRPNDAGAHLGKGLTLLIAGQYAGSASSLARAMELDSQVALKKMDLVKLAGGADAFIARFNDLAQKAETNPSPEQHFLLAYIYYQADQLDQARAAIEAARTGSAWPASVEILRAAIGH
jgi:hypothetical protein